MSTLKELHKAYAEKEHENLQLKDVLNDLFKENTGRHMLDSGGAYGRNWEENKELDDLEEDKEELSIRLSDRSNDDGKGTVEILPTGSVFHQLLRSAELSEEAIRLNHEFKEFEKNDSSNYSWLPLMKKWVDHEDENAHAVNTYNYEFTNYDQCIRFVPFTLEHDGRPYCDMYGEFVLIQIHGGCDIRGGYTAPIVLEVQESAMLSIGYSDLQIESDLVSLDFIEHEMYKLELYEHDLRAIPRDLDDDINSDDSVYFIVDLEGNEVSYYCGRSHKDGGRSVDPDNFKSELWKKQQDRPNEKSLNEVES